MGFTKITVQDTILNSRGGFYTSSFNEKSMGRGKTKTLYFKYLREAPIFGSLAFCFVGEAFPSEVLQ